MTSADARGAAVEYRGRVASVPLGVRVFCVVAVAYAAGAVLSWQSFGAGSSPTFFPPAGVTVAAMLLTRRSLWPVIVGAVVVAELAVDGLYGSDALAALGYTAANSVEPLVGASLVLAWCGGAPDLREREDLARFVAGACLLAPLVGGIVGAAVNAAYTGAVFLPGVLHWWAGDGVGALVVGAPILLWPLQAHILKRQWVESALVLGLTAALSTISLSITVPLEVPMLPLLAWAALRLDVLGAALAGLVLAFTANTMTALGYGIFAGLPYPPPARLAVAQVFIAVVVVVAMVIAQESAGRVAAVKQRQAEQRERVRLESLAQLAQLLSAAMTPEQVGKAAVSQLVNDAGAQALSLSLVSADGRSLEWVSMAGFPTDLEQSVRPGVPLAEPSGNAEAVRTRRPVVFRTPAEYLQRFPQRAEWMAATGAASLGAWPLLSGTNAIGALGLLWTRPQPLDAAQLAYASAVATMVAQALVRARVYADEHARAAVLYAAVLPASPVEIPGLEVAERYEPADVVHGLGGDWYDIMQLPSAQTYLAVGDVVGHGLPAVQDMAQLRNAGRALALQGLSPAQLLAELNTFARHTSNGKFATMTVAVFDPVSCVLTYARAGHPPALLRRGGGQVARLDEAGGPALGARESASYTQIAVGVRPGDTLVAYTDGLIERRGQDFDVAISRAATIIAGWLGERSLLDECCHLTAALAPAPRDDDVCVLAVRFESKH